MELENDIKPKRLHFVALMLMSFVLFVIGFASEQTLQWSNHWEGLMSGLIQGGILGVVWCSIYILPWGLIVSGLYRWRSWQSYRTQWILGPSILVLILSIGWSVANPPTPSKRFKAFAKADLPKNAQDLHFRFTGGGFADYCDTYFFKTTPAEVDRLIAELSLSENEVYSQKTMSFSGVSPLPDCPNFSSWKGAKQFTGWDEDRGWFYCLITDSTHSCTYVMISCI